MNRNLFLLPALLVIGVLGGCQPSSPALSASDAKAFKGSKPPADVWQKIARSRQNFASQHGGGAVDASAPGRPN